MSTHLSPQLGPEYSLATNMEVFFGERDAKTIRKNYEPREQAPTGVPSESCNTNLFFGFFFDGTKNNYIKANASNNHSNVARIYDCYPGKSVPGVLPKDTDWEHNPSRYTHFFKVYVPGVSSPFKEVGDSGEGLDDMTGAAAGRRGEHRIIWALVQAINNVHRYFFNAPLVSQTEMDGIVKHVHLNKHARSMMVGTLPTFGAGPREGESRAGVDGAARTCFEKILRRLHAAVFRHWPDKRT